MAEAEYSDVEFYIVVIKLEVVDVIVVKGRVGEVDFNIFVALVHQTMCANNTFGVEAWAVI